MSHNELGKSPRRPALVVLIETYLPIRGGAQNNVHELCRRLSRRGYRCEVLTRRYAPQSPRTEVLDGVSIRRLGRFPVRVISKLIWAVGVLGFLLRHRREYDLVLSVPIFYWPDLLPAYLGRLLTGKPFAVRTTMAGNFHAMLSWEVASVVDLLKKLLFPPALWRRVLLSATPVVAQSELLRSRARGFGLVDAQLIPNGVDTQRFRSADAAAKSALRHDLGLPENAVIAICTARFVAAKNQIVLLRAVERLFRQPDPPPLLLLLLGIEEFNPSLATEAELRRFVATRDLGDRVRFFRDVANVEDYLRASDVFVLPTTFDEGVSNSVLEAMACGLTVVCSDLPQLKAMFPPGEGLFFRPDDEEHLESHLSRVIARPDLRQRLGDALADHIRETQSIEHSVDAWQEILTTGTARRSRRG